MVAFVFFKWYFEKKWVGRAMGNETIYGVAQTILRFLFFYFRYDINAVAF